MKLLLSIIPYFESMKLVILFYSNNAGVGKLGKYYITIIVASKHSKGLMPNHSCIYRKDLYVDFGVNFQRLRGSLLPTELCDLSVFTRGNS